MDTGWRRQDAPKAEPEREQIAQRDRPLCRHGVVERAFDARNTLRFGSSGRNRSTLVDRQPAFSTGSSPLRA